MREMVGGCCVCSDDRGWSENPLVYCDGQSCTVAVHQACYGIVSVPTGPWYCRKCESQERTAKVKCELCPSKYGALKRTDNNGWAHVVCALYIPEVRFGNVTTMEPIQLQLIPTERFNEACYICEDKGKPSYASVGACMQCNKANCRQQFHVTCAQSLGLLCEEAGNYLDNVKYCGYCQHHYSKLKKGGNVKTIPPYKPVSGENQLSDSSSEKEGETQVATSSAPQQPATVVKTSPGGQTSTSAKRKSGGATNTKSTTNKSSASSSKTSTTSSKPPHTSSKTSDKNAKTNSTKKSEDTSDLKGDTLVDESKEKADKGVKKRKSSSRTPTPVSSVLVPPTSDLSVVKTESEKKESASVGPLSETTEKTKKARIETTQSILINQPIVALTSISTINKTLTSTSNSTGTTPSSNSTTAGDTTPSVSSVPTTTSATSLLVSVPLASTTLSPHSGLGVASNQTSVLTPVPQTATVEKSKAEVRATDKITENQPTKMITSELSGGGLKITYEKQDTHRMTMNNTEEDMDIEETNPLPAKRASRSQSNEKSERPGRGAKKRASNGVSSSTNSMPATSGNANNPAGPRRSSRSQHNTPPPPQQPGAFSSISQSQIKDSPPSSPSSESQGATSVGGARGRPRGRKSGGNSSVITPVASSSETKDIKLFQNGMSAPHMLGNQLNPNSHMAQKMSDHLNHELEAHSIFNPNENNSNLTGPQLHHRVLQSARASSASSSTTSGNGNGGGGGLSSMLGGGSTIPQTLDQLLERQWEQGSQFLMEQAQHFDIASLLSCLHQLRAENLRAEEHVSTLLQRRDHLLAVNARLAIPLTGQPATPQSSHGHTVNNIHPAVGASHNDIPRSRHSAGSATYPAHPQGTGGAGVPTENGLPSDPNQPPYTHRSPAPGQPQRSPTVRHTSGAGTAFGSGLLRQAADTSGRSAPRPQPYGLYQGAGPSSAQQQMVIRRDTSDGHHPTSKNS